MILQLVKLSIRVPVQASDVNSQEPRADDEVDRKAVVLAVEFARAGRKSAGFSQNAAR